VKYEKAVQYVGDHENAKEYWNEDYELIDSQRVVNKLFDVSLILGKRKAYVLLQRVLDLVFNYRIRANGLLDAYTIKRVNAACSEVGEDVFANSLSHYAANYFETRLNPDESRRILQRIFRQ
jgi:lysozyme family protein